MIPLLEDPRLRHRWNQIFLKAESAAENAAADIWTFQQKFINPCFASIAFGVTECAGPCFPDCEERSRRRTRGRAEASFDFYDDWDQDDHFKNHGLLGGWGSDELGKLLAGNNSSSDRSEGINQPPGRKRAMSYGTRERRKSLDHDPTVIPSTSVLGFLGRLPFRLGGTLRYKPSAADLQDHPGKNRNRNMFDEENEQFTRHNDRDTRRNKGKRHKRGRSSTMSSGETSNSFRSRRDLLLSDEEEDAIPINDEFSIVAERQNMGSEVNEDFGLPRSNKVEMPPSSIDSSTILSPMPQSPSRSKLLLIGQESLSEDSYSEAMSILSPTVVQTPSVFNPQQQNNISFQENMEKDSKRLVASRFTAEPVLRSDKSLHESIIENSPQVYANEGIETHNMERTNLGNETKSNDSGYLEHFSSVTPKSTMLEREALKYTNSSSTNDIPQAFVPARLPQFN